MEEEEGGGGRRRKRHTQTSSSLLLGLHQCTTHWAAPDFTGRASVSAPRVGLLLTSSAGVLNLSVELRPSSSSSFSSSSVPPLPPPSPPGSEERMEEEVGSTSLARLTYLIRHKPALK